MNYLNEEKGEGGQFLNITCMIFKFYQFYLAKILLYSRRVHRILYSIE